MQRLRKRLNVGEKEFEKFKFALVSFGRTKAIADGETLFPTSFLLLGLF